MQNKCLTILVLLLTIGNSPSLAVEGAEFQLATGLSIPTNPDFFSDVWDPSVNIGLGFGVVINPFLSVTGNLGFTRFRFCEECLWNRWGRECNAEGNRAYQVITISCNIRTSLRSEGKFVRPYIVGGIGLTHLSIDDTEIYDKDAPLSIGSIGGAPEGAFSVRLGTGCDICVHDRTYVFGEILYAVAFTKKESTQYIPIIVGLRLRI